MRRERDRRTGPSPGAPSGRPARSFAGDAAGIAAVEFALLAPFLLLATVGTLEFGRAALAYHQVVDAAARGARYAMVHGSQSGAPASTTSVVSAAQTALTIVDRSSVTVAVSWSPGSDPGDTVTVTVSCPFRFLVRSLPSLTLSSTARVAISN